MSVATNKTHLIVENDTKWIFSNPDIEITSQAQRHLGVAIGTRPFAKEYVSPKVQKWVSEICAFADLATTQPQAAYAAFVHGFIGELKYNYNIMRTIEVTIIWSCVRFINYSYSTNIKAALLKQWCVYICTCTYTCTRYIAYF